MKNKKWLAVLLVGILLFQFTSCGEKDASVVAGGDSEQKEQLTFFAPIARGNEKIQSNSLSGFEQGMKAFEEENSDVDLIYKTYTQKDYKEKSYDDVVLDRVRGHVGDDVYIMNPDVAYKLNKEDYLYDLADLEAAKTMTDAARAQCTIDGKVISVPMVMIAYGLFVNMDLLDKYGLSVPNTTKEFLHCCEVLKKNGVMPMAGNRWWLENFVLTQGFSSLYFEDGAEDKIAKLNSGETPISQYMKPGIEFLHQMMENEYFDVDLAAKTEAGDEKNLFLDQEVAFVIHYDGAVNDTVYGKHTFNMEVIGFPTDQYGQVNLMNASHRMCINKETEHLEAAKKLVGKMCSAEIVEQLVKEDGGFPAQEGIKVDRAKELAQVYKNVDKGRVISGSNPSIAMEQWGTTCQLIQDMLGGASVKETLQSFDELQKKMIKEQ